MQSSDTLFRLIKSMSKAEKRSFKLRAATYKGRGQSRTVALFDLLDRMSEYDENRLLKSSGAEVLRTNLAGLKHQLTGMLLESLAVGRAKRSARAEIRMLLSHIEVLYNKGIMDYCGKLVERAREKAAESGCHTLLLEVLEWKRRIALKNRHEPLEAQLQSYYKASREAIAAMSGALEYRERADRVLEIRRRETRARSEDTRAALVRIAASALPEEETPALPPMARILYWETNGTTAWMQGRHSEALQAFATAAALWEAHPALAADNLDEYKASLDRYLSCAAGAGEWSVFDNTVAKLRALPAASEPTEVYLFGSIHYLELLHYLNTGRLAEGRALAAEIEQGLANYADRLKPNRLLTLLHNCCIVYFLSGEFARALEFINRIQELEQDELKRDIQEFARIMRLILHYELRDFSAVEHMFRSTYRWLRKRNTLGEFEKAVIGTIRALLNCPDSACLHHVFGELRQTLVQLLNSNAHTLYIGVPELLFWVESALTHEAIESLYCRTMQDAAGRDVSALFA